MLNSPVKLKQVSTNDHQGPNLGQDFSQISQKIIKNMHQAAKVFNFDSQNSLKSDFSSQLDKIYLDFNQSLPTEYKSFIGEKMETINNYHLLSTSKVLLLCYTTTSTTELRLYSNELLRIEAVQKLTEDSLNGLIVEEKQNLVIVACGLFENRIFVFSAEDLTPVNVLITTGIIKSICLKISTMSFVCLMKYGDTVEWDLQELGTSKVLTSEKYDWIDVGKYSSEVVLATSYGKITCFTESGKLETKQSIKIKRISVSHNNTYIATDNHKEVTVFNIKENFLIVLNEKFDSLIRTILFIDSDILLVCQMNGIIFLYDIKSNRSPIMINIDKINDIKIIENNSLLGLVDRKLYLVKIPYIPYTFLLNNVNLAGFSISNTVIYASGKKLIELNTQSNVIRELTEFPGEILKTHFIDINRYFVATSTTMYLFDIESLKVVLEKVKEDDGSILFTIHNQTSDLLYTGGSKKLIRVYKIESFEKITEFGKHTNSISNIIPYDNWSKLISREENYIRIFNIPTQEEIFTISQKNQNISLSRDEKHLFIHQKNTIKIFDIELANFVHEFIHRSKLLYGVYFTKDGNFFISIGSDGVLRIWDKTTFTLISEIKVPGTPNYLKVSEDENYLMIRTDIKQKGIFIMKNPLMETKICFYGNYQNYFGFMKYFIDIKNMQTVDFQEEFEKSIIMPYKLTFSHIFSYLGMSSMLKSSLLSNPVFSRTEHGLTALDISLQLNYKNSVLVLLKYLTKKISLNPFIGQSITHKNLIDLNLLGFESLLGFYDSMLYLNPCPKYPKMIDNYVSLPKIVKSSEFIAQTELFGIEKDECPGGISVEFVSSLVSISIASGSQESIDFLSSLLSCPYPDVFRSQFIQIIIDDKWRRIFIVAVVEVSLFVVYMCLLSAVSLTSRSTSIHTAFFIFGFLLTFYEVLQIIGGVKVYLKDLWNFVDVVRSVLIILYLDSVINIRSYSSTILLILNLVSWIRGISYFRIFSKTRYMINLITEVCKDVIAFLVILAYSTIAFSFILMLMVDDRTKYPDYLIASYMITLGSINQPQYETIQWVCFVFTTIINPIIMMNLLISIMGDTHDRVQESKEVADYKELTSLIFEIEVANIFMRNRASLLNFHICREVKTKGMATTWMGKVREIKALIGGIKLNQNKNSEISTQILQENFKLKDQLGRIEKMMISMKEKLTVETNEANSFDVSCNKGHKLGISFRYENIEKCLKCGDVNEVGFSCGICSFFICRNCYKINLREKITGSEFTCYRDHKVTWLTDHTQYKNKQKVFRCVGCRKKLYKNSYNCQICSWDICRKCVEIVFTKASLAWTVACKSGHPLVWRKKSHINYFCNVCLNLFRTSGSFKCDACDYDVCIRCYDLMIG